MQPSGGCVKFLISFFRNGKFLQRRPHRTQRRLNKHTVPNSQTMVRLAFTEHTVWTVFDISAGLDEEWEGLQGSKGKGKEKADEIEEEYEDEEQLATVTVVEDFDPVELLHGPSRTPHEDKDADGDEKMEAIPSTSPRQKKPKVVETKKARSKATTKAKDIKYQTNSARKVERAKQTRRKKEKAERAGGKGMRKAKVVRGRR